MVNKKKIDLSFSDDEAENAAGSSNEPATLKINKNYAERYEKWRNKEEIQKLKDKYGDVNLNEDDEEDSEEDESEDEDARELNQSVEKEFFKTLSLVKSRDSRIYDKEKCRFFEEKDNSLPKTSKHDQDGQTAAGSSTDQKKTKKPYHLKDLERDMILKKLDKDDTGGDGNIFDEDEDDDGEVEEKKKRKLGYYEEQEDLKKSIKDVIKSVEDNDEDGNDDDDGGDGFLKMKVKSKEEKAQEEADYIKWLKGKKEKVKDQDVEENMKYLHDYWNDPNLNESEKYLRDYILNKRYLFKDGEDEEESSEEEDEEEEAKPVARKEKKSHKSDAKEEKDEKEAGEEEEEGKTKPLDFVDFSEEESIIENQEEFERKYNFRYEEPDPEFIKSYPRTLADSMRRKSTKRKEKRDEYKKRKEAEKQRKKEEIKRLKSLKRKEIEAKLEKIKKITGNEDLKLSVDDLENEFDPDEYERKMQSVFDDEYYQTSDPLINASSADPDDDGDKPVFTDDSDEDLKYKSWDDWPVDSTTATTSQKNQDDDDDDEKEEKKKKKKKRKKKDEEDEEAEPDFDMDCDADEQAPIKALKKTKLAQALLEKKPIYDPNEKTFDEYFQEYYKLDCEDVIGGDLPCRFKYREVVPNDFGLDVGEILSAKDTELNKWASLKKVIEYRPIQDEIQDTKIYRNRKNQIDFKKKVLTSLFKEESADEEEENSDNDNDDDNNDQEEVDSAQSKQDSKAASAQTGSEEKKAKQKDSTKKKKQNGNDAKQADKKEKEPPPVENKKKNEPSSKAKSNKNSNNNANNGKFKNKKSNMLESITDERLASFGLNPKKFKKKLKYSS